MIMGGLIFILGLFGFAGGILAVFALIAERDANMKRQNVAVQKRSDHNGGS